MDAIAQKPLPDDLSFEALFGPKPGYEYFARAAAHPFRPSASSFDLCNAWWLADACMFAVVLSQFGNPGRQDCDLHFRRAGVIVAPTKAIDQFFFSLFRQ